MAHAQFVRSSGPSDIAVRAREPGKQPIFLSAVNMTTEDSASTQAGSSAPSAEALKALVKDSVRELLQEVPSLLSAASRGPRDGDRTHGELGLLLCSYSWLLVGLHWWREIGGRGHRISRARSPSWPHVVGHVVEGVTDAVWEATQVGCNWHRLGVGGPHRSGAIGTSRATQVGCNWHRSGVGGATQVGCTWH